MHTCVLRATDATYFNLRDSRFGSAKAKAKYIEVQNEKDQDSPISQFKSNIHWLSGLRPAMALHVFRNDGVLKGRSDETYRKTLNTITDLLKVYPFLDVASNGDEVFSSLKLCIK